MLQQGVVPGEGALLVGPDLNSREISEIPARFCVSDACLAPAAFNFGTWTLVVPLSLPDEVLFEGETRCNDHGEHGRQAIGNAERCSGSTCESKCPLIRAARGLAL